jgi:hypothetical protein
MAEKWRVLLRVDEKAQRLSKLPPVQFFMKQLACPFLNGSALRLQEDVAKKQVIQVHSDCPKWPKGLHPVTTPFQNVQAQYKHYPIQIDFSNGLKNLHAPLRAYYKDYLERRHRPWPSNTDGLLASVDDVVAGIMRKCSFISRARAFCERCLQQPLQQQHPQLITLEKWTSESMFVTSSARLRVGCSLVARVAVLIALYPPSFQTTKVRHNFAKAITGRVYSGYCKRVQVLCCERVERCILLRVFWS